MEKVNPKYYRRGKIECIDAIKASMTPDEFKGFLKGNVIKYLWRYQQKNGSEDLRKANWYLERLEKEKTIEEVKSAISKEWKEKEKVFEEASKPLKW